MFRKQNMERLVVNNAPLVEDGESCDQEEPEDEQRRPVGSERPRDGERRPG